MNEQNRSICPFRMIANAIRASGADCLEGRCAWWFVDENGEGYCVIQELGDIREDARYIGYLMAKQDR